MSRRWNCRSGIHWPLALLATGAGIVVFGPVGCSAGIESKFDAGAKLAAAIDWQMQPHFPRMDTVNAPPPAPSTCPPPPPGRYTEGPIACKDNSGNAGCRYAAPVGDPLDFRSTPCLSECTPGTLASCKTTCGSAGTEVCGSEGVWGACNAFETCDGVDNDCDGFADVANGVSVCQVALSAWDPQHGPGWDTWLDGCASTDTAAPITRYAWEVDLPGRPQTFTSTSCKARFTFPTEGAFMVKLTVGDELGRLSDTTTRNVMIKNIVIASLGDSVASGEGNPDTPISVTQATAVWEDRRCHRSMNAAHARTALRLEQADEHTSVTYSFFSCSGAGIDEGLIGTYGGEEVRASDTPAVLPAQLSQLHRVMLNSSRSIDVLLLQIGANDMGFGDVVTECAYPTLVWEGQDVATCANDDNTKRVAARLVAIENARYPELKAMLNASVPIDQGKVYVSGYHDPTHAGDGSFCNEIRFTDAVVDGLVAKAPDPNAGFLSTAGKAYLASQDVPGLAQLVNRSLMGADLYDGVISHDEVIWAYHNVIVPLNATVERAVQANGWTFVKGLTDAFAKHGYCAGVPWVRHYEESKALQGNNQGTVHPNIDGHGALADLLFAAVTKDLIASGVFPAGAASDGGADGGSMDVATVEVPPDGPPDEVPPEAPPSDASVEVPVVHASDHSSNAGEAPSGDTSTPDGAMADAGGPQ